MHCRIREIQRSKEIDFARPAQLWFKEVDLKLAEDVLNPEMLFQYGSNMNPARLNGPERLNGAAEPIGVAILDGWGIRFDLFSKCNDCAVTDIVQSTDETVFGVLFEVPHELLITPSGGRSRMDEVEGARPDGNSNYTRELRYVIREEKQVQCHTYVGTRPGRQRYLKLTPQERRVSKDYFNHLLIGAKRFGLPNSYIKYLLRQAGSLK